MRISVLLTILADGTKLEPYIIFNGKRNSLNIRKELDKYPVAQKKIYYSFNENAWVTKEIMNDWFKKIWLHYLSRFDFNFESLLVLDHATSHKDKYFMSLYFNNDVVLIIIPKGLTCILQPLDTSINKPFKGGLKNLYDQYCIDNSLNYSSKVTKEKVIDFIASVV